MKTLKDNEMWGITTSEMIEQLRAALAAAERELQAFKNGDDLVGDQHIRDVSYLGKKLAASEARAGAAEQRAKKLADLLTLARLFVVSANFEAGYDGGSIRKQDLLPRIDAALSGDAAEGTVTK